MNPKKELKRLLRGLLVLLLFVFVFSVAVVRAVDGDGSVGFSDPVGEAEEDTCDNPPEGKTFCSSKLKQPTSPTVVGRYKIKLVYNGDSYVLSMSDGCEENVTFKVTNINGKTDNEAIGQELSCAKAVTITVGDNEYIENDFGLDGLDVALRSSCYVQNAAKDDKSCIWNYVEAELFITKGGEEMRSDSNFQIDDVSQTFTNTIINCKDKESIRNGEKTSFADKPDSFEAKFCDTKEAATDAGRVYDVGDGSYSGDPISLKCDSTIANIPTNPDALIGDGYFLNKTSLFGTKHYTRTANIVHHYAPGHVVSDSISCGVTCEEAVEVEYGPPVVSSAGMCFEYKVRVTTRVSCNMTEEPKKDNLCTSSYCTPYPDCAHDGGSILTQAGPGDEYNACVQSCDGGLYSKKCSTKCYNQVYGTVSAYAKVKSIYYDGMFADAIAHPYGDRGSSYTCNGYYDSDGSEGYDEKVMKNIKHINWVGMNSTYTATQATAGRWYCNGWQNRDYGYRHTFYADENGFFRKEFSAGSLCNAYCVWTKCLGNVYLNEKVPCNTVEGGTTSPLCQNGLLNILEYDCKANQEAYTDLVTDCLSKASCSTTTAEFTVSVDYTKADGSEVTVNFPYSGQKDTVTHSENAVVTTADQANTTLLNDFPYAGNGLLGCYKTGGEKDKYRVTWGTPSTWMNLKTGEISYEPKDASKTVWFKADHQFCLPGDAKPVNNKWANAYMHKTIIDNQLETVVSVTDPVIDELCKFSSSTTSVTTISYNVPETELVYNIWATGRKVGLLGWDINIGCFYAISTDPINLTTGTVDPSSWSKDCGNPDGEEYRVRSTDLGNLFPSSDGGQKGNDEAGRLPGFNWSKYAVNNKNTDYKSNPVNYMTALQTQARNAKASGTEIYTSDNLDYEFYLSPKTIREMRRDVAGNMGGGNYTSFSDSGFSFDTGLGRYRSEKIRKLEGGNKIPDAPEINCNNMLKYGSSQCDPVHDAN